jgi:hypothetical protein
MAEAQPVMTEAEVITDTYEVMANELDRINEDRPEEETVEREETVDASSEPTKSDSDTPTFKEAQEAQQDVRGSNDQTEESAEELQTGERVQEETNLEQDFLSTLKPKAQERFKELANRAAAAEEQYETLLGGNNQLAGIIQNSTTNPQQLGWALEMFKGLNSGNYEVAMSSLKALDGFSNQVAKTLGVHGQKNEKSSYSDFEDLSGAVENLEMSEEWATKLAGQRVSQNSMHQAQNHFQQAQQQNVQQQQYLHQTSEQAYQEIDSWESNLTTKDPDYALKSDIMKEMGVELARSDVPPDQWLSVLQNQYQVLSRGMGVAGNTQGKASRRSGPLAPSRNSGATGGTSDALNTAEVTPEWMAAQLDKFHGG